MSGESLLVILLVGLIAGWLAGIIMTGWGLRAGKLQRMLLSFADPERESPCGLAY